MKSALVVDDDLASADIFTYTLERFNFRTVAVHSAEKALEYLQDNRPDLILLDVRLPGQDGTAVIDAMLAEGRLDETRVILVSASELGRRFEHYDREFGFLLKPVKAHDLRAYLNDLL